MSSTVESATEIRPFDIDVPDPSLLERVWDFDLVDDVQTQPRYIDSPSKNAGMRGLLSVPIWISGVLKGSVNFFSWVPRRFTRDDVPVARRIADHIALALSHHRLAEEVRLNVEATRRADEATARARQLESRVWQLTDELDARTGYRRVVGESVSHPPAGAVPTVPPARRREDLKSVERAMIEEALQNARFNKSKAAKELGLSRHQLYVRIRRHGLE